MRARLRHAATVFALASSIAFGAFCLGLRCAWEELRP